MKPFNLEEYAKDPSKKVVTRRGGGARIICTDVLRENYPIVAVVKDDGGIEWTINLTKEGKNWPDCNSEYDLFFADDADEIPDFKPYDRVLTRGSKGLPWKANLFSNFKKEGDNTVAVCLKGDYLLSDIIPFDENKVGKKE